MGLTASYARLLFEPNASLARYVEKLTNDAVQQPYDRMYSEALFAY